MLSTANSAQNRTKGRPLMMLAVLMSVWMGSRLMMWEAPFPLIQTMGDNAKELLAGQADARPNDTASMSDQTTQTYEVTSTHNDGLLWAGSPPMLADPSPIAPLIWQDQLKPVPAPRGETAAAHQLVWLAAMAHLPVPQAVKQ